MIVWREKEWFIEKYGYYYATHRHDSIHLLERIPPSHPKWEPLTREMCPNCRERMPQHMIDIFRILALKNPTVVHGLAERTYT